MTSITSELISLLQFLLPGFVVASLYYSLTAFKKPSQFERIVEALIYTIIVNIFVLGIKELLIKLSENRENTIPWTNTINTIWALTISFLLGLLLAYLSNNDRLHSLLRALQITPKSGFSSQWYSAFRTHQRYVKVHLKDGKIAYGWPDEWSDYPDSGHLLLERVSWESDGNSKEMLDTKRLLISTSEIRFIEFMKEDKDYLEEKKEDDEIRRRQEQEANKS